MKSIGAKKIFVFEDNLTTLHKIYKELNCSSASYVPEHLKSR